MPRGPGVNPLLDELARSLASPMPRRRALRLLGSAIIAAVFPAVRVPRAFARRSRSAECGDCSDSPGTTICDCHVKHHPWGTTCFHCCCPRNYRCLCETEACACTCPGDKECGDDCCGETEICVHDRLGNPKCLPECKTEKGRSNSPAYNPETQCCTQYGVQQKYPMGNLEACRPTMVKRQDYQPTPNGCGPADKPLRSTFGKASFLEACNDHDKCYDVCGSDAVKCNEIFCKAVHKACAKAYPGGDPVCKQAASDYCDGVRLLGSSYWEDAQKKACQCCP